MKPRPVVVLPLLFLSGCGSLSHESPSTVPAAVTVSASGVCAGDDFFEYANGAWLRAHPIPADRAEFSVADEVEAMIESDMERIDREAAAASATDAEARKITDFMTAAQRAMAREAFTLPPTVRAYFAALDEATTREAVLLRAAAAHRDGCGSFWSFGAQQSPLNSDVLVAGFGQAGLSLPDRDYYLNTEPAVRRVRDAFPGYVATMLGHIGYDKSRASASAAAILAFETRLAEISCPMAAMRSAEKNSNSMTLAQLRELAPELPWAGVFAHYGLPADRAVNVAPPEYFKKLSTLIAGTPVETLKDYARFQAADGVAPYVCGPGFAAHFDFHGRVMGGVKEARPVVVRARRDRDRVLGEAVGRRYVALRFSETQRARYAAMFESVRAAFMHRLETNDWMDGPTRRRAMDKLRLMRFKVGYPDKWTDYTALSVSSEDYAENIIAGARFAFDRDFSRLGGAPDRDRWEMNPQTYNAYFMPSNNELVFPAASFVIPGCDGESMDDAVLYGFVGVVVGHEITHGFDDEGRKYDAKGDLNDWWTPGSAAAFERRSAPLVTRYSAVEPLPGLRINGEATLGENLADLGGVAIGLDAFKRTACYRSGRVIDGRTPLQRFFLAYAYSWAGSSRPEQLQRQLLSDVHSPARERVNLILPHFDEFREAFGIRPGDKHWLAPKDRVKVW